MTFIDEVLRHFSRLSPRKDPEARGIRFILAGGIVAIVSLTTTITLADGVGLPFQLALVLAIIVAVTLHFTLQRFLVWRTHEAFVHAFHQQLWRFLAVVGTQYVITAAITATVPALLGVPVTAVYFGTLVAVAASNFFVFRRIFRSDRTGA